MMQRAGTAVSGERISSRDGARSDPVEGPAATRAGRRVQIVNESPPSTQTKPRPRSAFAGGRPRLFVWLGTIALGVVLGWFAMARGEPGSATAGAAASSAPALRVDPAESRRDAAAPLGVDGFLALEKRLVDERQSRVQSMLDRLWPGRAFVTVGVELDPRWTTSAERIQPESPAMREDEQPGAGGAGARRRTYEPFSGERETVLLAPELRRVTAALVLDASIARDPRQQQRIVEAVKKAIGPVRGQDPDVEVLVESFAVAPPKPARRPAVVADVPADITVLTASVALAALGVAWIWLARARRRRNAASSEAQKPESALAPAELVRARREAIEQSIATDPVFASRLVESWIAEGRT